ncbi:MAG: general secretion pathway protein GspD [Pseudomonadota bacterium]|nr:general secretion pathway protein GspD [Pseudomonadota bacterium]
MAYAVCLGGCAAYQDYREGQSRIAEGDLEVGMAKLREAMQREPRNLDYRRVYYTQLETTENALFRDAEASFNAGAFAQARQLYSRVLTLDPANRRAADGLARIDVAERHGAALDAATALARDGGLDAAVAKVQQVLSENPNNRRAVALLRQLSRRQADASGKELGLYPKLRAAYRTPVSLSFTNATLLQVFEGLKQAAGLNYMIERDVRTDLRITFAVSKKPVEDILRLVLATNGLERRVLDDDTLLIYPNTPAKIAEYREMVVRSFYLNNAEASKIATTLKTIGRIKDVVVDEKLNMVIVRDSAEAIRIAEKLIASQDLAEPEVMLELEVLEVNASRLLDLGIHWPDSISASVVGRDGVAGQLRLDELRNRSASLVRLRTNDPLTSAQLRSQVGSANLLANPRVRIRNRQSAKVLIGERVPVITTTATANVGTSESVSYLDVGLKLDIEPTIALDDDVSMKIALEVSNILETITRSSGLQVYRLGTRNTSTTLRVHDGETNILAGLIQRDERHSNTGVPGLNELPLAGRLFGAASDNDSKTEIVLLITPHIVRNLDVPGLGVQEFVSGTEGATGASAAKLGGQGLANQQRLPAAVLPLNPTPPNQPARGTTPGNAPLPMPLFPTVPQQPPALTPPTLIPSFPAPSTPGQSP